MPAGSLLRRPSVFLALGLVAIAAVTTLLGRLSEGTQTEQKRQVLSDVGGVAAYPTFSPDGNRLAYAQHGIAGADGFHIVVRRLPSGAPLQLTTGAENDTSPAWSPDGSSIAFVRTLDEKSQLIALPAAGGSERVVAEFPAPSNDTSLPGLSWAHDGKTFAASVGGTDKQPGGIAIIDAASGAVRRITAPPAGEGDWSPEFSPDGSSILFIRASNDGANLYSCAPDGGNLRQLTYENHTIRGVSWMPDSKDVIFSADRNRDFTLWRMPIGSSNPRATLLSPHAQFPAVALKGSRIAFTESPTVVSVWRATLAPDNMSPTADRPLLRSQDGDFHAVYSPDGSRIAFVSGGNLWISDAEGANRIQVTKFGDANLARPEWSPDGKWLLCQIASDNWDTFKIAATAGAQPVHIANTSEGVAWGHDAKSVFYQTHGTIYENKMDGSEPRAVTPERRSHSGAPVASADGKYLFFRSGRSFWRVPVKGGDPEILFEPGSPFLLPHFEAGRAGIYFEEFEPGDGAFTVSLYSFDTKRISHVLRLEVTGRGRNRNGGRPGDFSVSADGKYILHPRVDQSQTNLIVVENFK